jgi:hypothetical protein
MHTNFTSLLFAVLVIPLLGLSACSSEGHSQRYGMTTPNGFSSKVSEQTYNILLAEFYFQNEKYLLAAEHYLPVALNNTNPDIAQRATELALQSGDLDKALIAARRWSEMAPHSEKLQKYHAI